MPSDNERKALWFLALVAVSGTGVRLSRSATPRVVVVDSAVLAGQIERVDSVRATRTSSKPRPPRAGGGAREPVAPTAEAAATARPAALVDLDAASAVEIETLPGIGPAMASRIVQHRDSAGPFGGMEAFCQVRGVGPALARRLRPLVTFTGPHRPVIDRCDDASKKARKAGAAGGPNPR